MEVKPGCEVCRCQSVLTTGHVRQNLHGAAACGPKACATCPACCSVRLERLLHAYTTSGRPQTGRRNQKSSFGCRQLPIGCTASPGACASCWSGCMCGTAAQTLWSPRMAAMARERMRCPCQVGPPNSSLGALPKHDSILAEPDLFGATARGTALQQPWCAYSWRAQCHERFSRSATHAQNRALQGPLNEQQHS